MLKRYFLFILFLLVGCSSPSLITSLPKQSVDSRIFLITQQQPRIEKNLLIIQFQEQKWRFIQTDPLGAPISRMFLTQAGWQNDGFIMPNRQAKQLFSAIVTYLFPEKPLFSFQKVEEIRGTTKKYLLNNGNSWEIGRMENSIQIRLVDDNSEWLIEELKQ